MLHGTDAQLTVVNGTGTVTLITATIPSPTGAADGISALINGAYGADSFKVNAVAGSYLEAWVEIQTADDANWRRLTPSNDSYRIYTTDAQDILAIDNIEGATMYRVRCALSVAPDDDVELDYMFLFEPDQKK
jgi:hypothetical protein